MLLENVESAWSPIGAGLVNCLYINKNIPELTVSNIDVPCLYLLLLLQKITRRLVPKVGDWSGNPTAAHHGVSGPGFDFDGLHTFSNETFSRPARSSSFPGPAGLVRTE